MEQSLSKDIRKLYTKSIIWTVVMSLLTIIVCIFLIALLQRNMMPANHAENKAIDAMIEMRNNPQKYLDEAAFSQKQKMLQEKDVYLSEYLMNGKMVSGPEKFSSLFKDEIVPNVLNTNITSGGYYHQVVPISEHGEIKGIWVYSYQLQVTFSNEYYRYMMIGLLFILFLSPIIYFIIFSRYYINKLYKSIKHPLEELMAASYKISQKDLEFNLNYSPENEIGQLTNSFKQMQSELKKSLYDNWRKDSEWAEMMSSLSHDLKTPITLIGMGAETLVDDNTLNEEQKNNLNIMMRNVSKANKLLENMNIASYIGDPTARGNEILLSSLISEIESDFKTMMENKSINYQCQSAMDMNTFVPYLTMNRVLQNVFSNAVQYTPKGGQVIFAINQKENYLLLALENSGNGIKEENWDKVFKKHYREDKSRPNLYGNSGLGLYISKQLIESINGKLVITKPKELTGVRFEIVLPLHQACNVVVNKPTSSS